MIKSLKNGEYEYNEKDFLGQGSFAKVYKGIIVKSQRVIAVRILSLNLIKQYGNKIKQIISGQVGVLKELSESNDINSIFTTRIFDCFLTEHNVTMILQFCPDGSLEDVVSQRGPLSQAEGLEILYQLSLGLEFICTKKVVHRDIKPDNIFLKKEGNFLMYKLGDFGFAVKKQINEQIVGTPIFMSPQLFREQPYGSEVDVWAFGLMAHYILFKEHFFIMATEAKVKAKVLSTQYSLNNMQKSSISGKTADLLLSCLQMDKKKRIRAEDICRHPAFDGCKNKIDTMVKEVMKSTTISESKLRLQTAKGKLLNFLMKFSFIFDLAAYLRKKDAYNLATLYLLKYNCGQLSFIKDQLSNRINLISHPGWNEFIQTQDFKGAFTLCDSLLSNNLKVFQQVFNTVMPKVSNNYGPDVAQGICNNLGNGPTAQMNPAVAIYQMKTNILPRLTGSAEDYLIKIQMVITTAILEKKQLDIDFCQLQMSKKQVSLPERIQMLEKGLKIK